MSSEDKISDVVNRKFNSKRDSVTAQLRELALLLVRTDHQGVQ